METMQEEDPTKYETHSSKLIANGVDTDDMEYMCTEAFNKIESDPNGE